MARIAVRGLTKRYGRRSKYCTVEDLEFTVEDGELFCLVGPSNAGKTSTLRLLAGLDDPDAGEITFDDEPVTTASPHERGASMLFQNLALYPNKTGYENIGHPLKVAGVPESERQERIGEIAEMLEITHLLDRKPATFSGGEKQRVGIGRALIKDASVHLLDEPLGGLDAKLKKTLRGELERIQYEFDETFILATHDQETAMSVADRIAVYRNGRIQQVGPPEELYDDPVNEFVAGFIGEPTMNFVDGELADGKLRAGPIEFDAESMRVDLAPGEYTVGIRPQDVALSAGPEPESDTGTVEVVEPLGQETLVDFTVGSLALRGITWEPFAKGLDHGDEVGVTITADDIYLFDKTDGRAIFTPPQ